MTLISGGSPEIWADAVAERLITALQARPALAIDALPPALAALEPTAVHVVYADATPARDALFWQSAARLLRARTTVLSPREPAGIADMLRAHGLDIERSRTLHLRANVCTLRGVPGQGDWPFAVAGAAKCEKKAICSR